MAPVKLNPRLIKWLIITTLVLIWGSSFILMKQGLKSFTALELGALRISISFLFLIPFAIFSFRKLNWKDLKFIALVGFIGNGIPAFLFAKAQMGLDSQIAGVLNSTSPLFTLIIGLLFFKFKSKWLNVLGVFIGLIGTVGLLSAGAANTFNSNLGFGIYIVIATTLYAININVIKKYLNETDSLIITSYAFMSAGPFAMFYLFAGTDFISRLHGVAAFHSLGYIAILAIMGTAIAGILYNRLIKISSILFTSSITYLVPIVAIMWGLLDGELFYPGYILWILLIFAGVFMVNKEKTIK